MEISFRCTSCRVKLGVDVIYAGRQMYCPQCNEAVTIPNAGLGNWSTLGDFRLLKVIGEGSTGQVFLARQNSMSREVALKVLHHRFSSDPRKLDEFYKEVKIIARLAHPNIVTALHAGQDGNYHYLAMNYISGGTLEDLIEENGILREKDALKFTLLCAQALDYAWEKEQILHLDIKPENIMLDKNGQIKVTDLGIARCLREIDEDDRIKGTPAYMSPEQASGVKELDVRSDIFSLGGTLFFLLTCERPFGRGNVKEVLERVVSGKMEDPLKYNEFISKATLKLLKDMTATKRNKRISDWPELIERLKDIIYNHTETDTGVQKRHKTDPRIQLSRKND